MKCLYAIVAIIFTYTSAYQVEKINVDGVALEIEFDSSSNAYINGRNGGHSEHGTNYDRFYKLDANYNVLVSQDFYMILKIIVNKQGDAYIFTLDPWNPFLDNVYYLKQDSTVVEFLFDFDNGPNGYLIDGSDNVYFNAKSGVIFFRSNQHVPLTIKNLEGYHFNDFEVDSNDNVYLAAHLLTSSSSETGFVALITEEGKQKPTPYAMIISNLGPGVVQELTKWQDLIFVTDKEESIASVKQVTHAGTSPILVQYDVDHNIISTGGNDRLLVIGKRLSSSYFHYITPVGDVVNIQGNLSSSAFKFEEYAIASDGTAYFGNNIEDRQILVLKQNETRLRLIDVPTEDYIVALETDEEDNLWVLSNKLYVLGKGEESLAEAGSIEFSTGVDNFLKYKNGTKELLISTLQGLYLCTEN